MLVFFVTGYSAFELREPVFLASCRGSGPITVFMPMPEAAVNEYRRLIFWQDYVRLSRKVAAIKPESIADAMQQGANFDFGSRIL